MRRSIANLAWFVCAAWLAGCTVSPPLPPADSGPRRHSVSVVSNGWHTAIIALRSKIVATGLLPEAADFPDAVFLEFGWGDREYYTAPETTLGMTLRAGLTATPAVMHVAGHAWAPEATDSDLEFEVVHVALTESEFRHLVRAISGDFKRPEGGRAKPVLPGLYPDSHFYDARGTFHLFNTCNTWTARMLRIAGVKLSPSGISTADELMARLRIAISADELSDGPTDVKNLAIEASAP